LALLNNRAGRLVTLGNFQRALLKPSGSYSLRANSGAELIVVSNLTATRVFMDYQLAKRGISLSGAYEVQHHATAISLVAAGVASAILPASTFQEGDRPGVRRIPLVSPVVKRQVILIQRKNSTPSPAAEAFSKLVKSTYLPKADTWNEILTSSPCMR